MKLLLKTEADNYYVFAIFWYTSAVIGVDWVYSLLMILKNPLLDSLFENTFILNTM